MRVLATLLLIAATPHAQVSRSQTISDLEGGFVGPLEDGDRFGVSAATLGDLDGDGRVEVAVGAYGDDDGRGTVWILSLEADGTVGAERPVRVEGLDPVDLFGVSVTVVGDLDGDGIPDLAVGADRDDDGGENRGAVWILFLDLEAGVRHVQKISATAGGLEDAPSDGDLFGHSVAAIGDLDGDGTPDLAVGGDDADDGGPERGAIWILFLRPDGTVRQSQRISDLEGGFDGVLDDRDLFSQALVGLGDLDGDGIPDLAASATLDDDGGADVGAVWVLFLRRDGTVREHQKISSTEGGLEAVLEDGDAFGSSLVAADLDGDGTMDLLVGAAQDDDGGPDRGAGHVLFLRSDGTVRDHQKLSDLEGGAVGPFGDGDQWRPLALLGDLDGDRRAELLFGSRLASLGGLQRGAARVLFAGYSVDREPDAKPRSTLRVPAPNPASSRTHLSFDLEESGFVRLSILDMLGREVAIVLEGERAAGTHSSEVNVSRWAPGVYVVRMKGAAVSTVRLVVAR